MLCKIRLVLLFVAFGCRNSASLDATTTPSVSTTRVPAGMAACSATVLSPPTARSGSVDFPYHDGLYDNLLQCNWTIGRNLTAQGIKISFTMMDIEDSTTCEFDYLDVLTVDGRLLQRHCGKRTTSVFYPVSTIVLRFTSDETAQGLGFNVAFSYKPITPAATTPGPSSSTTATAEAAAMLRNAVAFFQLYRRPDFATILLNNTDVNVKDSSGQAPLHMACQYGNVDAVKVLLDRGAQIEATDAYNGWGMTPLIWACREGYVDVVRVLVDRGAQIDAPSSAASGKATPLHFATSWGKLDVVKVLVDKGANINAKDASNTTSLRWAIDGSRTEIADFLRSRGGTM